MPSIVPHKEWLQSYRAKIERIISEYRTDLFNMTRKLSDSEALMQIIKTLNKEFEDKLSELKTELLAIFPKGNAPLIANMGVRLGDLPGTQTSMLLSFPATTLRQGQLTATIPPQVAEESSETLEKPIAPARPQHM